MRTESRREFLQQTTAAVGSAVWLASLTQVAKGAASERVRVGIMGAGVVADGFVRRQSPCRRCCHRRSRSQSVAGGLRSMVEG